MVQISRGFAYRRSLLIKNGHMECWMYSFWTLCSLPTISWKKRAWSNFDYFFHLRNSKSLADVWIYQKVRKTWLSFWTNFRNRARDVDSWCSIGFYGLVEQNAWVRPEEKDRCEVGFTSSIFLFFDWVEKISEIFDKSYLWRKRAEPSNVKIQKVLIYFNYGLY